MMAGGKKGRWQYEDDGGTPPSAGGGGGVTSEPEVETPPSGPVGGDITQTQQTTPDKIKVPDQFEAPDTTQNQQNQTQIKPPPTGNKMPVPNV